jgi:anaerobic magnesium-protoporphyrin IX monomethyl ester cyclase
MPRKKIVFYNPRAVFFTMPLGLLAVASALDRARYDVVIIDARLEADPLGKLLEALEGCACDHAGLYLLDTGHA